MNADQNREHSPGDLLAKCLEFVRVQGCGEWTDEMIASDAKAMKEFIETLSPPPVARTLRDEFAMAVLTGLIAQDKDPRPDGVKALTATAYKFADAMMAEREGK